MFITLAKTQKFLHQLMFITITPIITPQKFLGNVRVENVKIKT